MHGAHEPHAGHSAISSVEAGARASAGARALLGFGFVAYASGVTLSVLGLSPFASRALSSAVLLLALGVALTSLRGSTLRRAPAQRAHTVGAHQSRTVERAGRAAFYAGLAFTLFTMLLALLLPVGAYDALGYRLPAIAQWLDAGALVWVTGDDPLRNGYPLGLEVIGALSFSAFDSPAALDAVAGLFVLAGAFALAGYARELGLARGAGLLVAGLFLLVPMHLLNAPTGYADAAFAGVVVALLVAVARWVEQPSFRRASWLDLGYASALVIALKPHGFAFAALSLAAGGVVRARASGIARALRELAAVLGLALFGLFFAVRNVLETGNPLYPVEVRLGGHVLFPGEWSLDEVFTPEFNVPAELRALPSWARPLWVWLQPHGPASGYDERLAGLGYAFVLFGLPALAWLAHWSLRERWARRGLLLLLGLSFTFLLIQPLAFWPRFTSWLWGAAALAIALAVSELARRGHARRTRWLLALLLTLTLAEALFALVHVKRVHRVGLALFDGDPVVQLARVSGVDESFVRRALLGRRDLCRTPWTIGSDDGNLDGIVAQLSPRPRMHVIDEATVHEVAESARERGCDQVIVIGDSPLLARVPSEWSSRLTPVTAFGACHLLSLKRGESTARGE